MLLNLRIIIEGKEEFTDVNVNFSRFIQDQVIAARIYYIAKDEHVTNERCRKYKRSSETNQHITAGCIFLATKYPHFHKSMPKLFIKNWQNFIISYNHYKPKNVVKDDNYRLYWNRTGLTD